MLIKSTLSNTAALLVFVCISTLSADDSSLMEPVNYQQWTAKLESHIPNVVVVDMWAMWCVSCIERFPEMVEMHNRYNDDDVVFASMNLDDRDDSESLSAANTFLHTMNAKFDHYRMDENLMVAFEKINLIGIPAVLIYDSEGKERYRLTGDNPNKQFTEHDVEEAIKSLLIKQ
ncbi:MAG: TlpA disulfide reductase family protein [Gammaproteobacteria bacterium]|nr:TlpA disulfide reductase family protein [Gammaproteobacteria bacterium]